jgi:lipoprotein NlpD
MTRWALVVLALLAAGCMTQRSPAPVDDRRPLPGAQARPAAPQTPAPVAAPSAPGQRTYIVKPGDTVFSIALEQGVDHRELAQWNRIDDTYRLRVGQELRVTPPDDRSAVQVGGGRLRGELEARPLSASPGAPRATPEGAMKSSPKAQRMPYSEQNLAALSKPDAKPAATAPAPTAAAPATPVERATDGIDFIWPAKGRVVAGFAEPRSKGVDIAGKLGDPVVAAAAGRVIYVGSGIPGLGKFIVVRHDNGFNTVYAHNRENLVKMDQNLARGQKIAELGATDADSPKLHFQIRKFGTPLDPLKYLPPPG